jgi:transcription antitermination factor NusG
MAKRWHVIECFDGKDRDAYGRLAALGYEAWRPVIEVRPSQRVPGTDKITRTAKLVPLFGRYLFVRVVMSDSVYGAIREVAGVRSWVCMAGSDDPATVPDELISFYRHYRPQAVHGAGVYALRDRVRIMGGPFVNHEGVVVRVDSDKGVVVEIDIFGRPTPLPLPVGLVELVEQGRRPPTKRDDRERQRKRA